jgi:ABC-type transport system substrate-binding protein
MHYQRGYLLRIVLLLLLPAVHGTANGPSAAVSPPLPRGPVIVRLPDLARETAQAPPAVAALFQDSAKPSGEQFAQHALTKIDQFLQDRSGPAADLPPVVKLDAAEKALCAVLRHLAATQPRSLAGSDAGDDARNRLEARLLAVRRQQLRLAASAARTDSDWAAALARAQELRATYPEKKEVQADVAGVRLGYAGHQLKEGAFAAARSQLAQVDERLLRGPEGKRFQDLRAKQKAAAEGLVKEAAPLPDEAAAGRLREALAIWPDLPGVEDELLKRQHAYRVLYVGVRALPERLSPATAWTGAEAQALALLFQGLAEPRDDPRVGQFYRPGLAPDLPETVPGGRRFRLGPGTRWSDGHPVTSVDVRHTVQLLRASGRAPEWNDLIEEPRVEDDAYRVDFQFRQLPLDPLARLAFPVLPQAVGGQSLARADDPAFAAAPIGTGPYRYAGRRMEAGRTYAVFTANSHYARPGLPRIREVRFVVSADPAADFRDQARPLHLLLDLSADQADGLRDVGVRDVRTLENRRVYFLAVNHRVPALADQNLRRALAHAIDREQILNDHFRGSATAVRGWVVRHRARHPQWHRALNGPYPARSWASAPPSRVPAQPHDAATYRARLDQARAYAGLAKVKQAELTLKYPDDEPHVARACADIAAQVARLEDAKSGFAVRLKLLPLPPRQLKEALDRREYELAYTHLDYADESYWLWPLFDSRPQALERGGSNFLGYKNDGELASLFRKAVGERGFPQLQEWTHAIHAHLYEHMPLIPLWQLDSHLAVHPDLAVGALDPLRVFADVDTWVLKK